MSTMPTAIALPESVDNARLPANYEAAKQALSACSRIDECQSWADKAEALASYAKQSKDDSLRKLADRIQARAINRCGELLKQIMPATGTNNQYEQVKRDGSVPFHSRTQSAKDAGLSERQRKTALRVANVPREIFEALVESDNPPTVTALAEIGKKHRTENEKALDAFIEKGKDPNFHKALTMMAKLKDFAKAAKENDPADTATGLTNANRETARELVAFIDSWIDAFITRI